MENIKTNKSFYYGLAFVMFASFLWGVTGGLSGFLLDRGWNPLVIATFRGLVGLLFTLIWLVSRKKVNITINRRLILWSMFAGVGIAGNYVFYYLSIAETSVAIAATLMYTAPIFVFIISAMFNLERVTTFKLVSIVIVIIGIVLLTGSYKKDLADLNLFGILAGLLSGLSYAMFIFGLKNSSENGDQIIVLALAFLVQFLLVFTYADKQQIVQVVVEFKDIWWFILTGIAGAGLSFFFYVNGLKKINPGIASIVAMIEPVTASLFGVLVLGQFLSPVQLVGMAMILFIITFLCKHTLRNGE
ncbi:DMT family transporter [Pseudalkalibacillus sp. SCS-8]|uniref:DMT family transporter n=1 Tax=Pseudalkalibacillus nanhaiensis TaxID=3115291 RepID=UPI0032DA2195